MTSRYTHTTSRTITKSSSNSQITIINRTCHTTNHQTTSLHHSLTMNTNLTVESHPRNLPRNLLRQDTNKHRQRNRLTTHSYRMFNRLNHHLRRRKANHLQHAHLQNITQSTPITMFTTRRSTNSNFIQDHSTRLSSKYFSRRRPFRVISFWELSDI